MSIYIPTMGSLFSGIGGFELAAQWHGAKVLWQSEIEPWAVQLLQKRFPDAVQLGDITRISGSEIPPVDFITFGSPCQDMSVAGNRAGLDGERSGLLRQATRIIREMRKSTNGKYPKFAIWENVPGAFTSNKGLDFKAVLEEIAETDIPMPASGRWANAGMVRGGAADISWRILDAQYWGVPQRRKRIYLVADYRSERSAEILFKSESVSRYPAPCGKPWQGAAGCAEGGTGAAGNGIKAYRICSYASNCMKSDNPNSGVYEADKSSTLDLNGGNPACNQGGIMVCVPIGIINDQDGNSINIEQTDVSPTLRAQTHGNLPIAAYIYDARGNGDGDTSPTMIGDHNNRITDYSAVLLMPAYAIDRAAFNQGKNAQFDISIKDDGVMQTVVAKGPNAVGVPIYSFYPQMKAESQCFIADIANTIVNGSNPGFHNGAVVPIVTMNERQYALTVSEDVANTPTSTDYKGVQLVGIPIAAFQGQASNNAEISHSEKVSPTIQCAKQADVLTLTLSKLKYVVRRLTPSECALLQGFPADWHEGITNDKGKPMPDTAAYKGYGNAVATVCAEHPIAHIIKILKEEVENDR